VTPPPSNLRLQGVYEQSQPDRHMLRVKLAGGLLDAEQAESLAGLAERFASGVLHLTTRMSIELHGIAGDDLDAALRGLGAAGLTSRGACGGAVRGVAFSTPLASGAERARALAARIQGHFTGNPEFENLPKKFKVGVDAGYPGARHLIQDVGLVLAGRVDVEPSWDAWVGGGLGRQPREAFLLARAVPESRVVPLVEAAARLYQARTPAGKRLKHAVAEAGEDAIREALAEVLKGTLGAPGVPVPEGNRVATFALARVFAGELPAKGLRTLGELANRLSGGRLVLTPDQDVALPLEDPSRRGEAEAALAAEGFGPENERAVAFRICPGSHECKMGLAPTRDAARDVLAAMGPTARALGWAISGCPNGCAQPHLADVGLLCTRLPKDPAGERRPLYDVLRREGDGFGQTVLHQVPLDAVLDAVRALG